MHAKFSHTLTDAKKNQYISIYMLGIWPPCNSLVSGNLINLLNTGAMLYNKGITDDADECVHRPNQSALLE